MNREEDEDIQRDLKNVMEWEKMIHEAQEQALHDLQYNDVKSIEILIKLAKSHVDSQENVSEEDLGAIRFMENRVRELG